MRAIRSFLILTLLLIFSLAFSSEFKIIQRSDDGRFYLDEQTVLDLANYVYKLERLNENYKEQISVLEQMVQNLKLQVQNLEKIVQRYESDLAQKDAELKELTKKLEAERAKKTAWTVVAAIAIGAAVILFIK